MFDLAGKKVCVAGSTGFLGSWICRELLAEGAVVRGVSRSGNDQVDSRIESVTADLRDYAAAFDALEGQDSLIVAAAVTSGAQVMANNPLAHLLDNTLINASLMRAATLRGISRVVFISSSTVYPVSSEAMAEEDATGEFFSSYEVVASMKKYFEDSFQRVCEFSKTEAVIVRPGNAYGPGDHFDSEISHVIPALVSKVARANSQLQVWGDGKDIKNFIFAPDLAEGIVQALRIGKPGGIYNLGGPGEVSVHDVVRILLSIAGKNDLEIVYDTSKPSMIPVRRINSDRAYCELGFQAKTGIEQGLRMTYKWYASQAS